MSARDRFELTLPERLEDLAAPRTPSYFDKVIDTTARTRQRPGWSFAERWFPVSTFTDRMVTAPRAPLRAIAVASLVILAIAAILVLAVGSNRPRVPSPFGPAENGRIVWVDASDGIVAADADGTNRTTLVARALVDSPLFSPDGARLLYLHAARTGTEVIVGDADGSNPVTIATYPSSIGVVWAPDSRFVVTAQDGILTRLEATADAVPAILAEDVPDAFDWNVEPGSLFRPPAGDEIAFIRGAGSEKSIVVAGADGSSSREILTPATAGFSYADLGGLRWSPDGTRLAFVATLSDNGADTRVFILDADGGAPRRLTDLEIAGATVSENNPQWSPDGTRIAMQVWHNQADSPGVRPLTVVDVDRGDAHEVGDVSLNGFMSFAWSPDGAFLLQVNDGGTVRVLDAVTGETGPDPWTAASGASWQRLAP